MSNDYINNKLKRCFTIRDKWQLITIYKLTTTYMNIVNELIANTQLRNRLLLGKQVSDHLEGGYTWKAYQSFESLRSQRY